MTGLMQDYGLSIVIGVLILLAAMPYIARIRHPEQKPLAAYLIFITVFIISATVLFNLFVWLLFKLDLGNTLSAPVPALLFLAVVLIPAIIIARWLARKPPWQPNGPGKPPD